MRMREDGNIGALIYTGSGLPKDNNPTSCVMLYCIDLLLCPGMSSKGVPLPALYIRGCRVIMSSSQSTIDIHVGVYP